MERLVVERSGMGSRFMVSWSEVVSTSMVSRLGGVEVDGGEGGGGVEVG